MEKLNLAAHPGDTPDPAVCGLCTRCMHAVPLRGRSELVCLAYLAVCRHDDGVACAEFEQRPQRSALMRSQASTDFSDQIGASPEEQNGFRGMNGQG